MITSKANSQVKYIKRLLQSTAFRREEAVFVLESPKLVRELQTQHPEMVDLVWVRGEDVAEDVFDSICDAKTSQGVLAVVKMPLWNEMATLSEAAKVVVLDGIQDPANVGAILRSAVAFGVDLVVLRLGTADPFSPKALRAGAGAVWQLPVLLETDTVLSALTNRLSFYALDAGATDTVAAISKQNWGIILGSEGQGVSAQTIDLYGATSVSIPTSKQVESLNVAVAAGIVLAQAYATSA